MCVFCIHHSIKRLIRRKPWEKFDSVWRHEIKIMMTTNNPLIYIGSHLRVSRFYIFYITFWYCMYCWVWYLVAFVLCLLRKFVVTCNRLPCICCMVHLNKVNHSFTTSRKHSGTNISQNQATQIANVVLTISLTWTLLKPIIRACTSS